MASCETDCSNLEWYFGRALTNSVQTSPRSKPLANLRLSTTSLQRRIFAEAEHSKKQTDFETKGVVSHPDRRLQTAALASALTSRIAAASERRIRH
eukprot:6175993-Pleurochrysis_carterae.AAC.3